jgi:5-methyltetrahydropteroyltriglutamate--homocysteine methyltransferase
VKSEEIEASQEVAARIRRALDVVPSERLIVNPDCGLRHLPVDIARAKLRAMVEGTAAVRRELSGAPEPDSAPPEPDAAPPHPHAHQSHDLNPGDPNDAAAG